ncbi:MAG: hypothetical protein V3U14_13065, partial [candidate division NC10 bacterium]
MAFTTTARQAGNNAKTSVTTLTTAAATNTADSLLLAFASSTQDDFGADRAPAISTPTGGGLTWTEVVKAGETEGWSLNGLSPDTDQAIACHRAVVGGSPSSFAITHDHATAGNSAFMGAATVDITGHDPTTPIIQAKANGGTSGGGDSESGTVEFTSALTVGSRVIVYWGPAADVNSTPADPTIGGQTMTSVMTSDVGYHTYRISYRDITGDETDKIITCADLGEDVLAFTVIAVEVAAAAQDVTAQFLQASQIFQPAVTVGSVGVTAQLI